ncbi:MAG: dihydrofolate reductase [Bacteroidales bacterium]|nr:dihydrofolate reductase [Bacteroidales bacterium]
MKSINNKNISIIVAIAENNAIGKNNELLWSIPEDMQWFKKHTSGHPVIMGRRTFLSLPKGALPNRRNIVISDVPGETFPSCEMVSSIEEALLACDEKEESFIIGGGMIYRQFLPHARRLYITRVHKSFDADTFFPEFNYDEWKEVERQKFPPSGKNDFSYSFIIYERK